MEVSRTEKTPDQATEFRFSWYLIGLTLVVLALSAGGVIGAALAWGLVAVWAIRGADEAVEAILMTYLLNALNPGLFVTHPYATVLRWFVISFAVIRVGVVWYKNGLPVPAWFRLSVLFVVCCGIGVITSYFPMVSFFKLFAYFMGSTAIFLGIWLGRKREWGSNLLSFGVTLAVVGLPLTVTSTGYLLNGHGFQGIFGHPQPVGVVMSVTFIYAFVRWVVDRNFRPQVHYLALLGAILAQAYLSEARTGMFAALLGGMIGLAYLKRPGRYVFQILLNPVSYAVALILPFLIVNYGHLATGFVLKWSAEQAAEDRRIGEILTGTRLPLIELSWENFSKNPLTGIGFGLPSSAAEQSGDADSFWGMPVGLSTEKGFLATGLLEEVGLIGAIPFVILLIMQIRGLKKSQTIAPVMLFFAALFINFGEMIYFSIGGLGTFMSICLSHALTSAAPCQVAPAPEPPAVPVMNHPAIAYRHLRINPAPRLAHLENRESEAGL